MNETKDELRIRKLRERLEKNFREELEIALNILHRGETLTVSQYPLEEIIIEAARRWLEDHE